MFRCVFLARQWTYSEDQPPGGGHNHVQPPPPGGPPQLPPQVRGTAPWATFYKIDRADVYDCGATTGSDGQYGVSASSHDQKTQADQSPCREAHISTA
ncbi:MAG: hypothetical protein Q9164_000570 [Protoblastenia rupestris]